MGWYITHNRENCAPERGDDGRWWGGHDQDTDPDRDDDCVATQEAARRNSREDRRHAEDAEDASR